MAIKNELILSYIKELAPGTKISVRKLAEQLDVSEGTVYKAIKLAEAQGLVVTKPKAGTFRVETGFAAKSEPVSLKRLVKLLGLTTVVEPADYDRVMDELEQTGDVSLKTKRYLQYKVFEHTAQYDCMITDVSRAWPCNGKFSERQRILYECVLATSNHLFSIIRPGMKMEDVDATIRRYNAERLVEAGVLKSVDEVGRLMWHGGSHHIGYDVHDMVKRPEILAPNMVFCVDVGVYNEEWGIGFRLEDNCLVTEDGCENLSAAIPRTIEDIEAAMRGDV